MHKLSATVRWARLKEELQSWSRVSRGDTAALVTTLLKCDQVCGGLQLVAWEAWVPISEPKIPPSWASMRGEGAGKGLPNQSGMWEYSCSALFLWEAGATETSIARDSGIKMGAMIPLQVQPFMAFSINTSSTIRLNYITKYKTGDKRKNKRSGNIKPKDPGLKSPIGTL